MRMIAEEKQAREQKLTYKDRFEIVKEIQVGFITSLKYPEMDLYKFATQLEERLALKNIQSGIEGRRTVRFEESLSFHEEMKNIMLSSMVEYWKGCTAMEAEEYQPTHLDVFAVSKGQREFGFGKKYQFIFCFGDPIMIKKDLKSKELNVLEEGCMFIVREFFSNWMMKFVKFAPRKNESVYKPKSMDNDSLIIAFYRDD